MNNTLNKLVTILIAIFVVVAPNSPKSKLIKPDAYEPLQVQIVQEDLSDNSFRNKQNEQVSFLLTNSQLSRPDSFRNLDQSSLIQSNNSFNSDVLNNWLVDPAEFNNIINATEEQLPDICNMPLKNYFKNANGGFETILQYMQSLEMKKITREVGDLMNTVEGLGVTQYNDIYTVNDTSSGSIYTVKFYRRDQFKSFTKEVAYLKRFSEYSYVKPASIIYYYGCLYDDQYLYVLMEPGKVYTTLSEKDVFDAFQRLQPGKKKEIAINISMMVRKLHKNGVAHGSIQPDNILVNFDFSEIRLMNFHNSFETTNHTAIPNFLSWLAFLPLNSVNSIIQNDLMNLSQLMMYLNTNIYVNELNQISTRGSVNGVDEAYKAFVKSIYAVQSNQSIPYFIKFIHKYCKKKKSIRKVVDAPQTSGGLFSCCIKTQVQEQAPTTKVSYDCNSIMRTFLYVFEVDNFSKVYKVDSTDTFVARLAKCEQNLFEYRPISSKHTESVKDINSELMMSSFMDSRKGSLISQSEYNIYQDKGIGFQTLGTHKSLIPTQDDGLDGYRQAAAGMQLLQKSGRSTNKSRRGTNKFII